MGGRLPARHHVATLAVAVSTLSIVAACGTDAERIDASFGEDAPILTTTAGTAAATSTTTRPSTSTTTPPSTISTSATTSSTTTPSTTSTTTSTTTTSTTSTTTTTVPVGPPPIAPIAPDPSAARTPADPAFGAAARAFDQLAANSVGATLTISHGGELVMSLASGATIGGAPATADTPMVVASVSKLVTGVAVARLIQLGLLADDEFVPWDEIGITPHPGWTDVTIRELLEHSAGMPVARQSWFRFDGVDCPTHLQALVAAPPQAHRGGWTYSNGNFCLLGLVVEARSGLPLAFALQHLVFDPVGVGGVHLTDNGLLPSDMPHPHAAGVGRLSRLGAAGNLVVSTDDVATAIGRLTEADRAVLTPSTLFRDQYGVGHTGTIDGAKACVWALDGGATVVAATVAGQWPSTGGGVCDLVVPAVAVDLGIGGATRPDRDP